AFRDDPNRDVAIGDRPYEPVPVDDWRETDVLVTHHLRGVGDGLVRVDRAWIRCHQLLDALRHLVLPLYGFERLRIPEPRRGQTTRMTSCWEPQSRHGFDSLRSLSPRRTRTTRGVISRSSRSAPTRSSRGSRSSRRQYSW